MSKNRFFMAVLMAAGAVPGVRGATITNPPSPMAQGGMVHINVTFTTNNAANAFDIHVDSGSPVLKPLTDWSPGNNFVTNVPWFDELDPAQDGLAFNSQFGFLLDVAGSDTLPSGQSFGIRLLTNTPGLEAWFLRTTPGSELFDPVFTPAHEYVLWNGTMWHTFFTADSAGAFSAQFEIFVATNAGIGAVDYTTVSGEDAFYSTGTVTLNWTAIPEPSTLLLAGGGLLAWMAAWLRRRRGGD